MSILKKFFKDTVIYGIASITPRLVSFVLVPIHTSSLNTALYSVNTNYYVYAVFLNALLTMGMETAFFRFFSSEKEPKKVLSTSFLLLCFSSGLFLGLGLIFEQQLSSFFGFGDSFIIRLLVLTIFFDTLVVIPFAFLRATGKSMIFAGFKILSVLITLILNIYLLIILPESGNSLRLFSGIFNSVAEVTDIFIANAFASFIILIAFIPFIKNINISVDRGLLKKMVAYGFPIMVAGMAYAINENLDKLFISRILGDDVNGMYAGCYKLGVFMSLYVMAFRLGAEPFFFNLYGTDGAERIYSKILTWFVIFASLCMVVVSLFIDVFADILLKQNSYKQALDIVPFILLANIFLGIYNNLSIWYKLKDKTRVGMFISVVGAVITILMLTFTVPVFGYIGAAYTTLVVYAGMAVSSFFIGKRYYPIPYDVLKISLLLLSATVISFTSFHFFRSNHTTNFLLLCGFIVIVLWSEKDIFLKRVEIANK